MRGKGFEPFRKHWKTNIHLEPTKGQDILIHSGFRVCPVVEILKSCAFDQALLSPHITTKILQCFISLFPNQFLNIIYKINLFKSLMTTCLLSKNYKSLYRNPYIFLYYSITSHEAFISLQSK